MSRLKSLTLVLLATTGSAFAQEGALPLTDLLDEARTGAPSMDIARLGLQTAEHGVGSAVSLNLPRVSLSERQTYRYNNPERYIYSYNYESDGGCVDALGSPCLPVVVIDGTVTAPENVLSNAVSISGFQPVIAPRQIVAVKQARGRVEMAELQVKGQEEQLVLDLLSTYFSLQGDLGERAAYQRSLELTQELEGNLVVRFDTGQSTALDLERARQDVIEAQVRIRQLDDAQGLSIAELLLNAGAQGPQVRVCGGSPAEQPGRALEISDSTRLSLMEQQVHMQRLSLTASRTSLIPTLNVVGGISFTGNGESMEAVIEGYMFDNWYIGGTLSLSLFEGLGRYHSTQSAQIDLSSAQAKLSQERLSADLSDRQLAMQLDALSEDIALMDRSIVLAEANLEAIRTRYLAGLATFEMWTYARQSLEGLRIKRVTAIQQQWSLASFRWISAGRLDELLAWLGSVEDTATARGVCSNLTAASLEESR